MNDPWIWLLFITVLLIVQTLRVSYYKTMLDDTVAKVRKALDKIRNIQKGEQNGAHKHSSGG